MYEALSGKSLFSGNNNCETLKSIFELRGKPSLKFLKQGQFTNNYFKDNGNGTFFILEKNDVGINIKEIPLPNLSEINVQILINKFKEDNPEKYDEMIKSNKYENILNFFDLLDKCLTVDPLKRISSFEAILHPFLEN